MRWDVRKGLWVKSLIFLAFSLLIFSGCFSAEIVWNSASVSTSLSVTPIYPKYGANWNDYVVVSNSALGFTAQPDVACVGTEPSFVSCYHGGELRKATLTGVSSCTGVTAQDDLGVFNWLCQNDPSSE